MDQLRGGEGAAESDALDRLDGALDAATRAAAYLRGGDVTRGDRFEAELTRDDAQIRRPSRRTEPNLPQLYPEPRPRGPRPLVAGNDDSLRRVADFVRRYRVGRRPDGHVTVHGLVVAARGQTRFGGLPPSARYSDERTSVVSFRHGSTTSMVSKSEGTPAPASLNIRSIFRGWMGTGARAWWLPSTLLIPRGELPGRSAY